MANLGEQAMKSYQIREIVGRFYDNVEIALWAILLAFVVFMAVFVVPMLPALRAQYQKTRAQQIADETALYCEKLNMTLGTSSAIFVSGSSSASIANATSCAPSQPDIRRGHFDAGRP